MKKSIFVIVALFAATFANAQITLEYTSGKEIYPLNLINSGFYAGENILYEELRENYRTYAINLYDASTYDLIYTLSVPNDMYVSFFGKNIFTSNNTYAMLCSQSGYEPGHEYELEYSYKHFFVYDATGKTVIADLGKYYQNEGIIYVYKATSGFKLAIHGRYDSLSAPYGTRIYALPGNGETTNITSTSSYNHSARKVVRNGKMLVETENNTYSVSGQEVK